MNWNGMKVYPLLMKILASTHTNVDLFPGKPLVFDVYLWFIGDFWAIAVNMKQLARGQAVRPFPGSAAGLKWKDTISHPPNNYSIRSMKPRNDKNLVQWPAIFDSRYSLIFDGSSYCGWIGAFFVHFGVPGGEVYWEEICMRKSSNTYFQNGDCIFEHIQGFPLLCRYHP